MMTETSLPPASPPPAVPLLQLRPYQREALAAIEQSHAHGRHAALICLPTGCGKTVVFSELIRRWSHLRVLVLAHREELLTQAIAKISAADPTADVGMLGAGRHDVGHHITVASIQTLSRPRWLATVATQRIGLVIVDEAHHAVARSYARVLAALGAGERYGCGAFLLGVTATPLRQDDVSLTPTFGPATYVLSIAQAIAEGYLCDLRGIRIPTDVSLHGVRSRGGDWIEDELAGVCDTPERNALVVASYLRYARGRSALAFCVNVAHARHLADIFTAASVRAAMVCGETPHDERERILHAFAAGALDIITNVAVLTEGVDLPITEAVLCCRPTQSQALYIQTIGRGSRLAPGKTECLVLDFADVSGRHSLVQLPDLIGKTYQDSVSDERNVAAAARKRTETTDVAGVGESSDTLTTSPASATWSLRDAVRALEEVTARPASPSERPGQLIRQWAWKRIGSAYTLTLETPQCRDTFTLEPDGGEQYVVYRQRGQGRERLTPKPLPLGWAQALAEETAERLLHGNAILVNRDAPWRSQPASAKQLWLMRKKRLKVPTGCTKGQAADALDAFFARQKSRAG